MDRIIGFTGPRNIIGFERRVDPQLAELDDAVGFVTGGCTGLDTYVGWRLVDKYPKARHTVIVPGKTSAVTFWWLQEQYRARVEVLRLPAGSTYQARNKWIVKLSTELIGFALHPEHDPRSRRSGSWQTIRIARTRDIPRSVIILSSSPAESPIASR